jgi:hypothetical protein
MRTEIDVSRWYEVRDCDPADFTVLITPQRFARWAICTPIWIRRAATLTAYLNLQLAVSVSSIDSLRSVWEHRRL